MSDEALHLRTRFRLYLIAYAITVKNQGHQTNLPNRNGSVSDSPSAGIRKRLPGWSLRCILYIMRRTQLYLDDGLWNALHASALTRKTTVSELVREAVRERYFGQRDEQRKAMQAFVGIRRNSNIPDAVEYIRSLRRGDRLDRLHESADLIRRPIRRK